MNEVLNTLRAECESAKLELKEAEDLSDPIDVMYTRGFVKGLNAAIKIVEEAQNDQ